MSVTQRKKTFSSRNLSFPRRAWEPGTSLVPRPSPFAPRAFTLVEVMVVLIVVAVLTAFCVPSFQRAMEQSRADVAAANLRAIWSAERLYWLENHAYTANLTGLQDLGMIDPEIVLSTTGYVYSATTVADGFQATAERTGSTFRSGQFTIDETGLLSGAVTAAGEPDITPGFQ